MAAAVKAKPLAGVIDLAEATGQATCRRLPVPGELVDYPNSDTLEAVSFIVKWYLEAVEKGNPVEPVTLDRIGALAVFAVDARNLAATVERQAEELLHALTDLDEAMMAQARAAKS